jgi:hypothetical protein
MWVTHSPREGTLWLDTEALSLGVLGSTPSTTTTTASTASAAAVATTTCATSDTSHKRNPLYQRLELGFLLPPQLTL